MQRVRLIVTTICLLIACATTDWAQTGNSTAASNPKQQAPDLAAQVRQLAAEVRSLKLEMLKLRFESQQAKLAQVERELEQTQISKRRLEAQETGFNRELAEIDERLREPDLEASEQTQLEAAKVKMAQGGQQKLYSQRLRLAQQEAEIKERLAREQERWQELVEQARKLGIEAGEKQSPQGEHQREWSP